MTETTMTAATAAPLTSNMHALFTAAIAPYMSGDQEPTADLVDSLLEAVNSAEPTPELIRTLHQIITATDPTEELLGMMHNAIGAAIGLRHSPALVPGYAPRTTAGRASGTARPGSVREQIAAVFAEHPGQEFTTTQLANTLNRSGGAIGAALDTMIGRGDAVLTSESPKRYRATTDNTPAATVATEPAHATPATAPDTDASQATATDQATETATTAGPEATDAVQAAPGEQDKPATARRAKK